MKISILLMASLVTVMGAEIPEDYKPLEKTILQRILTPEDTPMERDIKSLFAQYILLAAMENANATTSEDSSSNAIAPSATTEMPRLMEYGKTFQPQQAPAAATPQIIYVYVTAPPQQIRDENIKTKKPTKPPRTKKPKPPRTQHPWHVESQPQQQPQQIQVVPQPIYIQVPAPGPPPASSSSSGGVPEESSDLQPPPAAPTAATPAPPAQQIVVIQQVPATSAPTAPAVTTAPILTPAPGTEAVAVTLAPTVTPRPHPSQEHVLNQVDKILQNVSRGNITGIVDQSLAIRTPMPVRNLVNGILNTVFCNPINRLLNRCRG